ncbi:CBS domain-containing protein [Phytoactinopolyspora halotolerans]|uniref:CBS domain-containing protein n=1 Tax=Phytoactinopolyspora halotolerans TaxID=1981512 RepID=UPI001C209934|nr:CBS domain-containing protein [Phytoactinopolyspora halotolerans]
MVERGSDKHGPRQDDELKHELHGMEQADRPVRVEEWRDPEPPADDDPDVFTGQEPGVTPQTVADAMTGRVISVNIDASLADAAVAMRNNDVGDVLVLENGMVRGVLTDRDLVVRAAAEGRPPDDTSVDDVCSSDVTTVVPGTPIDDAVNLMREYAIRRLPVVDEDLRPVGVVTLGDVALAREPDSALADISAAPANR